MQHINEECLNAFMLFNKILLRISILLPNSNLDIFKVTVTGTHPKDRLNLPSSVLKPNTKTFSNKNKARSLG